MGDWMTRIKWLAVLACFGVSTTFASFARVESMGKRAEFFMDDVSIFDNPANMNIFPNFLIGELGAYGLPASTDTTKTPVQGINRDPENSWFGGIFSYSLSRNKERGNLYPQISLGGAFNRKDTELLPMIPDSADGKVVPEPVTNFDGFLGMTLANGGMLGSHVYVAMQQGGNVVNGQLDTSRLSRNTDVRMSLFRGDIGMNWPLGKDVDGELSLGAAQIAYGPETLGPKWSYFVKARAFSTVQLINGELVPMLSFSHLELPGISSRLFHFGLGTNVSLDRGFFWLGLQGIFDETNTMGITQTNDAISKTTYTSASTVRGSWSKQGVSVGFGIERNIWWDWLVLRVGGRKEIAYTNQSDVTGEYTYFYTNPTGDATSGDQVGFGIGVNIEEKLKVDATLAEDVPYTFGNLFSGPLHHIISRISATYSF